MTFEKQFIPQVGCCGLKCCFKSTETVGLLGTGAQDIHLDFHTAPELCTPQGPGHFALRPQKRGGLLGTGTGGEGDERVKARPRIPPERDRRDRGPPPEQ